LTNSFVRANPLLGLTAEEYKDFACALLSYVALHATADQTAYFMNLCREYTREIAAKVAVAAKVRPRLTPVLAKGERPGAHNTVVGSSLRKPRSH